MRRFRWPAAAFLAMAALFTTGTALAGGGLFSHRTHTDIECEECHAAAESEDLTVSLIPGLDVCGTCHETSDLDEWGVVEFPRVPSLFEKFSHRFHMGENGDCASCHAAVGSPREMVLTEAGEAHQGCFSCHDGLSADNDCGACHTETMSDALSGTWWGRLLQKPSDHVPGILHSHRFGVETDDEECLTCHEGDLECGICHHGENVEFAVHDRNWRYSHGVEATKHLHDCSSCHEADQFCTGCHADEGIRPWNHAMEGWVFGEAIHGQYARRDLEYCASCHQSDRATCGISTACHQDDNIRGNQFDRNIHPPGWRGDAGEGDWHDDDGSACFECHSVSSRTSGIGFCTYCHGAK